jgi:hypothetical protein
MASSSAESGRWTRSTSSFERVRLDGRGDRAGGRTHDGRWVYLRPTARPYQVGADSLLWESGVSRSGVPPSTATVKRSQVPNLKVV